MHIDPQAWGIDAGYWNAAGHWQETAEASITAVAEAMGAGPDQPVPPDETAPLWFVASGCRQQLRNRCALVLEDGTDLGTLDVLP
ncbi:MAG TPA: hypothetical protein VM386_05035, partial [Acidimicrobiales bacterium]|nr:hypothetical protein [Acidimicrobiales bacterium]